MPPTPRLPPDFLIPAWSRVWSPPRPPVSSLWPCRLPTSQRCLYSSSNDGTRSSSAKAPNGVKVRYHDTGKGQAKLPLKDWARRGTQSDNVEGHRPKATNQDDPALWNLLDAPEPAPHVQSGNLKEPGTRQHEAGRHVSPSDKQQDWKATSKDHRRVNTTHQTQGTGGFPGDMTFVEDEPNASPKPSRSSVKDRPRPTRPKKPTNAKKAPSLLTELFPETSDVTDLPRPKERELPPVPLPSLVEQRRTQLEQYHRQLRNMFSARRDKTSVLILRNASTELDEQDFRALVPRGKHISEWLVESDILKVFPAREPYSLKKTGSYFLQFGNIDAAQKYLTLANEAHRYAQLNKSTSLLDPLPPAPGILENGVDVYAIIQNFTLVPAGHKLLLELIPRPYPAQIAKVLQAGGYYPIVDYSDDAGEESETRKAITKVLLSVRGSKLTNVNITSAIGADGLDRGQAWPLTHHLYGVRSLQEVMEEAEKRDYLHGQYRWQYNLATETNNKWLLSFKDAVSARQFVQSWHRRPLRVEAEDEMQRQYTHPDEVSVELLW